MKLQDLYKHKETNSLIQIDSFATKMNSWNSDTSIVVFTNIMTDGYEKGGYCPSFNGYGTREEIEEEYELFIPQEELGNYNDWDEIFEKLNER